LTIDSLAAFDALAAGKGIDDAANYQWRIARRPNGNVVPDDFAWGVADIPEPGTGEALLRVHYLGLAPVMRMYMTGASPSGEVPLNIGDVIHGRGVAQVIKSRHPDWREGEMVQGQCGWQTYKVTAFTPRKNSFACPAMACPLRLVQVCSA
jgi:NADPH-dependent curcumin reductase